MSTPNLKDVGHDGSRRWLAAGTLADHPQDSAIVKLDLNAVFGTARRAKETLARNLLDGYR